MSSKSAKLARASPGSDVILNPLPELRFSEKAEEVVHTRNVIAFFVWAWPSGFCD